MRDEGNSETNDIPGDEGNAGDEGNVGDNAEADAGTDTSQAADDARRDAGQDAGQDPRVNPASGQPNPDQPDPVTPGDADRTQQ